MYRRYQRTATTITSGGNRNPANARCLAAYQAVTEHHLRRPPDPTVTAAILSGGTDYKVPADYDDSEES